MLSIFVWLSEVVCSTYRRSIILSCSLLHDSVDRTDQACVKRWSKSGVMAVDVIHVVKRIITLYIRSIIPYPGGLLL
jgi:hypothetical protein